MSKKVWVRECKNCSFNNPKDASRCNRCGQVMVESGFLSATYHFESKWACPKCSTLNYADNKTCASCLWKEGWF
jgi:phage FluMu protein Com